MEKIQFDSFYKMFQGEFQKLAIEKERTKPEYEEYYEELFLIFGEIYSPRLTNEEKIELMDKSLFEVCVNYVSLSNINIEVFPKTSFEFVSLILENREENPYQESFLQSLQFIVQDYLQGLKKGRPILFSTDYGTKSAFKVILDSQYQISEFNVWNMDLWEQDKTMFKILSLEKKGQIGPIPKVRYLYRKDI